MKTAGLVFTLTLATTLTATAQLSAPPSPEVVKLTTEPAAETKLSPEVSQKLTNQLPKYSPPAEKKEDVKPAATPVTAVGETDPDLLELPKIKVLPKKRPRLGNDVMMTTKAYDEMLAREKLSSLDRNFLNKFTLPSWFGGVSAAERARDEYDREKRAQMANEVFGLAKVVEITDPEQAKALRDAVNR